MEITQPQSRKHATIVVRCIVEWQELLTFEFDATVTRIPGEKMSPTSPEIEETYEIDQVHILKVLDNTNSELPLDKQEKHILGDLVLYWLDNDSTLRQRVIQKALELW